MKESFAIICFICAVLFLLSFAVYIYFNTKEIELYDRVKERLADKERITDENIRLNKLRFPNEKW